MKFGKDFWNQKWVSYSIATCSAVVLYLFLSHLSYYLKGIGAFLSFFEPVFFGLVIAYVLNPLVKFYKAKLYGRMKSDKARKNLALFTTILSLVLFFVLLSMVLIPQIIDSVVTLFNNLGAYAVNLQGVLGDLDSFASNYDFDISKIVDSVNEWVTKLASSIPENLGSIMTTSFSIGKSIFNTMIALIIAIYLLADKERLQESFKKLMKVLMPGGRYRNTKEFWSRCNTILLRYIGCSLLDALIIGVANSIFMAVAGLPYNAMISVIVGLTNLAPTFGPIVGGALGAFILVLVNPWYALWFIIFTVVIQTVDGYFIKPKLFGNSLGVPAVWILIVLIVGGGMFGVAGILLAIPFAAIFSFVYNDMIYTKLEQRNEKERLRRESLKVQEESVEMETKE